TVQRETQSSTKANGRSLDHEMEIRVNPRRYRTNSRSIPWG
ncbi:MAG: hypothetical protein ACI9HK_003510, partial [Pirellulaceae bacterium]